MSNIKKNFIYNFIYQVLILIIPLITSPYLSRVIGSDGVGIYSYTYSIVYYFMLLTLLGVNNYGNRSIAKVRNNKKNLSHYFWNIYSMQLIMGLLMFIIYIAGILLFAEEYKAYFLIQSMFVLSSILDINWFFFGIEDFKSTITRNSIVKVGSLLLIFIFVRNSNDLWKYVFIMSSLTLISQILMWSFLLKKIHFTKPNFNEIKQHIKPNIILFLPVIAVSIYKVMDKVMLGALTPVSEVGFYENAEKIISIPMTLISTLGTVMLPRMSNLMVEGNKEKVEQYIKKSINFIMFLAFPICFGLITIGNNFAPLFFGIDFEKTGTLIVLLAITFPILSFANVIRTQYLIPKEKDKVFLLSSFYGAIVNFIINFLLIPKYASIGACIGTIFAEVTVMLYQIIKVKNEIPVFKYLISSLRFLIPALIMFILIYPLNLLKLSSIYIILIQVCMGAVIYFILNYKYILEIIDLNKILSRFRKNDEMGKG